MKHFLRINVFVIAVLAMMSLALPLALLHISSSLFPESAINRFYSSLVPSGNSDVGQNYYDSSTTLFIVRKPGEGIQVINLAYSNAHRNTPEFSTGFKNNCKKMGYRALEMKTINILSRERDERIQKVVQIAKANLYLKQAIPNYVLLNKNSNNY